jgi:threonine/homoserine/homoserine lactone efflux protein
MEGYFLQGMVLGLSLSFMVGPLLFAILDAGIHRGFGAGVAVAAGIWLSDALLAFAALHSLVAIQVFTASPIFRQWAGWAGAGILVAFGIASLFFVSKPPDKAQTVPESGATDYATAFMKGFLINMVNPFSLFFWIGITIGVVVPAQWDNYAIAQFFIGLFGVLMLCDVLKAYGARQLREQLHPHRIYALRRIIGLLLVIFGIVLAFRAQYY